MQANLPFATPQTGISRDERWEAKRRQREQGQGAPPQITQPTYSSAPIQTQVYLPPPGPPQQVYAPPPASYQAPVPSYSPNLQTYVQPQGAPEPQYEYSPQQFQEQFQSSPAQFQHSPAISTKHPGLQAQPPPADNSFFTNPISDGELRRRQLQAEYKKSMTEAPNPRIIAQETPAYVPTLRGREQSRGQIKMIDESKKQYQEDLRRQAEEQKLRKSKEKSVSPEPAYFPFGKPGAGAPYRDPSGKIVAVRPPHYNENDPRFVNPNRLQIAAEMEKLKASAAMAVAHSADQSFSRAPGQYPSMAPQYSNPQFASQYPPQYPPMQAQPPQYRPPSQYGGPSQYPGGAQDYPPQQSYPAHMGGSYSQFPDQGLQMQPVPVDQQQYQYDPNIAPTQVVNPTVEIDRLGKHQQKLELGRALQEQMDERRRQKEEEKRQRLLEERMEEARLDKQRRELEEEQQREADKRRRQLQELQAANDHNVMVASQAKRNKRTRTPIDMPILDGPRTPPREPPRGPQPSVVTVERAGGEIPIEITQKMQSTFDNELWRMKNEMNYQQNELRDAVLRLRNEAQHANDQRIDAMRQIDAMKEGMRQRQLEEDIRSRELYMVLSNAGPMKFDAISKLPNTNALPLALPRGKDWAELSLDGTKSLNGESKFLPLGGGPAEPFMMRPLSKDRRAVELDSYFPSLPDVGPANMSLRGDASHTAMTSLGVDNISKRNDERLKAFERLEGNPGDELAKLDELLFNFLDKDEKSRMTPLASIKEAEADASLSLPRSANYSLKSDSISFY